MTFGRRRKQWIVELIAICAFLFGMGVIAVRVVARLAEEVPAEPWIWAGLLAVLILGYIAADFLSGFVHFLGDSFFSADTPIIGKAFIYPFREHHVDPEAITRHGFLQTNGNNSLVSLFVLPVTYLLVPNHPLIAAFLFFLLLGIFATNQFHSWAHQKHPSRAAQFLQRTGIILRPDHHKLHHVAPYRTDYCITVGWLNPLLGRIGFFPFARRVLSRVLPEG